jgi:protein gp37
MADVSKIEWTDSTFNPWVGCTKVSFGRDRCYAEAWSKRSGLVRWGNNARRQTSHDYWRKPLKWNADTTRRRCVFRASLADVFDNQVDPHWRADLFALIRATAGLDWQLLTKRPQNIGKMLPLDWNDGYPNVWLGITAEDDEHYRQRWSILVRIPPAVRFVSYESAIGSLGSLVPTLHLPDWIICGGESGPGARIMEPAWARALRDQCSALNVTFFMKQMTGKKPIPADLLVRQFPDRHRSNGGPLMPPSEINDL